MTEKSVGAARENGRPPKEDLVRACRNGVDVQRATPPESGEASANENGMPTLFGHFTRFNEWTEIDSWYEGNFLERIAPGAFKKTFREQQPKVLFQHGMDGTCGDKPLGPPDVLREEDDGPYYEVPLLDASYVRDLIPGLDAGLYGASFRFSVMREEWVDEPAVSEDNPKGLPERTIKEVRCSEFGPVTFPAYPGATAGVRSMTDEYLAARMTNQPADRLRSLLEYLEKRDETSAVEQELPPTESAEDQETARAATDEPEQEPPGEPTALYFGKTSRTAAPGQHPTPLYTGKDKRKGWAP